MTARGKLPALLALVVLFSACARDTTPTERDMTAEQRAEDAGESRAPADEDEKPRRERSGRDQRKGISKNARASSESEGDDGSGGEEAAEDDRSSRYAPAPGVYTYAQEGFEEFCDAARCEREDLPARQNVTIHYEGTQGDALVVVTRAHPSANRTTRTTALHSPERALITKVNVRLDYEGFSFTNTYRPDPPVESLRYPLRAGDRWSGSWKDSTSGDYTISVGAKRTVHIGGSVVQAYPVRTTTTFRGELDGRGEVTVWIDPATAAVVKNEGRVELKSVFGRYNTTFSATLQEGPEYR